MRDVATRKVDVLGVLEGQGHYWLSTADESRPHAIGVSAWWNEDQLVVTTLGTSRTARNMTPGAQVVLVHGDPVDAVVIHAKVAGRTDAKDAGEIARGFKEVMGWEPGAESGWSFFRLRPTRIQAYRGYDEIEGREVMKAGRWLG
ncbi:MAG TPA: hypothetical protein VJT78_03345 [Candidatus Dormibacteraeota bacterium]|nr:hypothetical protein [Candidatus Dormibacteraeota bacterium]